MISIDTNIVVRLLTRDDPAQFKSAQTIFQTEDIFIPDSVILETGWVLRFAYDFKREAICASLRKLFGLKNVYLGNSRMIARILDWYEQGMDFADAFHLALSQQCSALKTFDKQFIKQAKAISACKVEKP